MLEGYHPPLEEYLEAVYELEEDGINVIQARLTERLGHSAPTVSETIRRLRDEGYVNIDGRTISLTDTGKTRAESVMRRHRLAEHLLIDMLGVEWHKAHLEATRWEHVISDEVEEKLLERLGNPKTCPHGNPMPGIKDERLLRKLSDAAVGETVRLERVTESVEFDTASLTYLGENRFVPGVEAEIREKDDTTGDLVVVYGDKRLPINGALSQLLYVAA